MTKETVDAGIRINQTIEKMLKQALIEGTVECPYCANTIESGNPLCTCGWQNPLTTEGYI